MNGLFTENKYYIKYETHLRHLNELMANGLGDTEEAEAVRDRMDTPWYHLTEDEAERLRGLSADLYMLQNDEVFQPSDGRTKIQIGQAFYTAIKNDQWEEALKLMRQPNLLPRVKVAAARAAAYQALGELEAALLFLRYASKLDSKQPVYKVLELSLLRRCNRKDEARQRAEIHLTDTSAPARLHIEAAVFLMLHSQSTEGVRYDDIVSVLEHVLQSAVPTNALHDKGTPKELMTLGYMVLGSYYLEIGAAQKARDAVQVALDLSPSEELASLLHDLSQVSLFETDTLARHSQPIAKKLQSLTRLSDVNRYAESANACAAA